MDGYIPLPIGRSNEKASPSKLLLRGKNRSGNHNGNDENERIERGPKALRPIHLSTSVLSQSDGSALVEFGHTKILCSVHGPRPFYSSSATPKLSDDLFSEYSGYLNCELRYAPHFGMRPLTNEMIYAKSLDSFQNNNSQGARDKMTAQEIELSSRLQDALRPMVILETFPKCVLDVNVMVLQSDGSVLPGAIMASCLALTDSCVELYDLVASCTVAISSSRSSESMTKQSCRDVQNMDSDDNKLTKNDQSNNDNDVVCLVDPNEEEMLSAQGLVTLAMMANSKEVTFCDVEVVSSRNRDKRDSKRNRLASKTVQEALDLCKDGCLASYRFMKSHLSDNPSS